MGPCAAASAPRTRRAPPAELLRATLRTYLQIGHGGFRADRLWGLGLLLVELGDFGGCQDAVIQAHVVNAARERLDP